MIDADRERFTQARRERDAAFRAREETIDAEERRLRARGLAVGYVNGVPVDAEIAAALKPSPYGLRPSLLREEP